MLRLKLLFFWFAASLIVVCGILVGSASILAAGEGESQADPDEMLAEEVIIELPEAESDGVSSHRYTGGVPLLVILPFAADAPREEQSLALAYGIAAGIVDNIYPLSAVRTIPIDRLMRAAGHTLINVGALGTAIDAENVSMIADAVKADFVVTGDATLNNGSISIQAVMLDGQGNLVGSPGASGNIEELPALISRLAFDILMIGNIALTDKERDYLNYAEPYGTEAWFSCHYGLSIVTLMLSGFEVDKRDIKSARSALEKALDIAPGYVRAREALGIIEYLEGKLQDARSTFRELATRTPDYAPARFYLGVIEYNDGRYAEAKKELTLASDLNKFDPLALLYLGRTYLAAGQPAMAEQVIRQSLAIDPGNPDVYFALGLALMKLERYNESGDVFAEVVMRNPSLAEAHYNLAISFYQQGEFELAIKHFRHYIELTPDDEGGDHRDVEGFIEQIAEMMAE